MHIFDPKPRKFEPAKITAYTVIGDDRIILLQEFCLTEQHICQRKVRQTILYHERYCKARQYWRISQNFGECTIFNSTFIDFEVASNHWSAQFVQFLLCFSLVTINRQASYDSGILPEDYGIIRGYIGHHQ